jgi:hypothetical protein
MSLFFISSAVCENEGKDLPALRDQACEAGVSDGEAVGPSPWIRGECGDILFPWNPLAEIFVWVNQECCNVIRHLILTLAKSPEP